MTAGKHAHSAAAVLHQNAANQHTVTASAHVVAASANRLAGNEPAAKLDDKATREHQKAAAKHIDAAAKHTAAARQSGQRATNRQKASSASQKAGVQSMQAGAATQKAAAADPSQPADPADSQAAQNQVTQGQLAQQSSNQAVASGTEADQEGQAASTVGNSDGGLINSLVEQLNLTGVTKTMVDHNRFFTLALIVAVILFIFFYGTEPKIDNPFYVDGATKCCPPQLAGTASANTNALDSDDALKPLNPSDFFTQKRVTEAELQTELNNYLNAGTEKIKLLQADLQSKSQQVQDAIAKIEAQKAALAAALKAVTVLAVASAPATGPIGPLIGIVSGLIATGLVADNVRKSSVVTQNPGAETANS